VFYVLLFCIHIMRNIIWCTNAVFKLCMILLLIDRIYVCDHFVFMCSFSYIS